MSTFKEMQSKNLRRFVFKQYFHTSLLSMTALKWGRWEQLGTLLPSDMIRPHVVQISSFLVYSEHKGRTVWSNCPGVTLLTPLGKAFAGVLERRPQKINEPGQGPKTSLSPHILSLQTCSSPELEHSCNPPDSAQLSEEQQLQEPLCQTASVLHYEGLVDVCGKDIPPSPLQVFSSCPSGR